MKIYGISGLGADKRVFDYLDIDYELIPIDWIKHYEYESIEDYARRLSKVIKHEEKFGILGVSFGGLIAIEMSKFLKPQIIILISSARTKYELRKSIRLFGNTKIINIIPAILFNPPRLIVNFLFGTKNKTLLDNILKDTDLKFAKWSVKKILNWSNTEILQNTIKISGTNDKLIPPRKDDGSILINNGEHFMIVDKAKEISKLINEQIKKRHHNNG